MVLPVSIAAGDRMLLQLRCIADRRVVIDLEILKLCRLDTRGDRPALHHRGQAPTTDTTTEQLPLHGARHAAR